MHYEKSIVIDDSNKSSIKDQIFRFDWTGMLKNTVNWNTIFIDGKKYYVSSDDEYLKTVDNNFEPHMVSLFKKLIKA